MKKTILFLTLISSVFLFAQSNYEISKAGFTDFIVTETPGKTKEDLYAKTLEWINKTYKNPKEVIKAEVMNDYVRFEGLKQDLYCYAPIGMAVCSNVKYQIEVYVKDGKYKFDVIEMESYSAPSKYGPGGWFPLMANNSTEFFYKKDGNIKNGWKNYINAVPDYFNSLNDDLKNYLESGTKSEIKNDW